MYFVGGETVNALSVQHREQGRSQLVKIGLMGLLTVFVSLVALGQGSSSNLDVWTTAKIVLGLEEGTSLQHAIIWELRLPRVLMAIVGGIGLATAGALMQGCLGNPLVLSLIHI